MRNEHVSQADDGCDSFDDDLEWILEKLNERAGGSFGIIVRFVDGIQTAVLMARTASAAAVADGAMAQITDQLRAELATHPQLDAQDFAVSPPLTLKGFLGSPVRLLHMGFKPAPGVDIVAAVCRSDSSASLLHGIVARRLHPVLARYIRVWWMHRTERRRANAFEHALDLAELGILLLDRRGHFLYANAYVRKILKDADGMRRVGDTICPTEPADALRLQAAIQHALAGNALGGNADWQAPLVLLRRGEAQRALIVTVLSHQRPAVDPEDAAAVMYVLHPQRDVRKCLLPVYRIYGLTPAESRLVTELVNGANLVEAATGMNVSLPTVRAQLKQVFDKTRTNRQAELVRVMLASAVRSSVTVDLSLM